MPPKVWNKRDPDHPFGPNAVYVGRPSKWGNPFRVTKRDSNEEACARYRNWLGDKIARGTLDPEELRGKHLICWCAPLQCHADILLELANQERVP
jgi:hypothetical protein